MNKRLLSVLENIGDSSYLEKYDDSDASEFYWNYQPWGEKFQIPFHQDVDHIRAVFSGNKVGKTLVGVMEVFMAMTGHIPKYLQGTPYKIKYKDGTEKEHVCVFPPEKIAPPNSIAWFCCESESKINDTILPKVFSCVPLKSFGIHYTQAKWRFDLPGNRQIFLKTYEQREDSFTGGLCWMVAFDEECPHKKIFTEAYMRTIQGAEGVKNRSGYFLFTCTPLKGKTWLYHTIMVPGMRGEPGHKIYRVDMDEAPHLNDEDINRILKKCPPHERQARRRGEFTIATERLVFNAKKVNEWIENAVPPVTYKSIRCGQENKTNGTIADLDLPLAPLDVHLEDLKTNDGVYNPDGIWRIWEEPRRGYGYVLSVDSGKGEGPPEGDYSVAHIKRRAKSGTVFPCATLRSNIIKPYEFGRFCLWAARYYNNALIACESDGPGDAVLAAISFYPHLWSTSTYGGRKESVGVPMRSNTRQKIIEIERDLVDNQDLPIVFEYETLEEMSQFTFVTKGEKVRAEHIEGGHDDGVFASAIADWILMDYPSRVNDNKPFGDPYQQGIKQYANMYCPECKIAYDISKERQYEDNFCNICRTKLLLADKKIKSIRFIGNRGRGLKWQKTKQMN